MVEGLKYGYYRYKPNEDIEKVKDYFWFKHTPDIHIFSDDVFSEKNLICLIDTVIKARKENETVNIAVFTPSRARIAKDIESYNKIWHILKENKIQLFIGSNVVNDVNCFTTSFEDIMNEYAASVNKEFAEMQYVEENVTDSKSDSETLIELLKTVEELKQNMQEVLKYLKGDAEKEYILPETLAEKQEVTSIDISANIRKEVADIIKEIEGETTDTQEEKTETEEINVAQEIGVEDKGFVNETLLDVNDDEDEVMNKGLIEASKPMGVIKPTNLESYTGVKDSYLQTEIDSILLMAEKGIRVEHKETEQERERIEKIRNRRDIEHKAEIAASDYYTRVAEERKNQVKQEVTEARKELKVAMESDKAARVKRGRHTEAEIAEARKELELLIEPKDKKGEIKEEKGKKPEVITDIELGENLEKLEWQQASVEKIEAAELTVKEKNALLEYVLTKKPVDQIYSNAEEGVTKYRLYGLLEELGIGKRGKAKK